MPSRRRPVTILLALACALIVLPAADAKRAKPAQRAIAAGILSVTVDGGRVSASRAPNAGAVRITLSDVDGVVRRTFRDRRVTGRRTLSAGAIGHRWQSRMGAKPIVELRSAKGRTTLYSLLGAPTWDPASRSLTFSARASRTNRRAVNQARSLGDGVTARILPTRAVFNGRRLPPHRSTRQSNDMCTQVQPAFPGSDFCLAYTPALGAGNTSWVNILSGTMQPASSCQVPAPTVPVSGNPKVIGRIDVYEDAASAQAALSVSASLKYSKGIVSAQAKAAFSASTSTSDTSIYAIAQVNLVNGTVNLGDPSLTLDAQDAAADITDFPSALEFVSTCGDSIPTGYSVGASWMAVLQLETKSEQDAASLYAKVGGSVAGVDASQSFSTAVSSASETTSIVETDYCAGPPSCSAAHDPANPQLVYTNPATVGSDPTAVLNAFTTNYSLMLGGLSGLCNPGATLAYCVTAVQYAPIYPLLPDDFSDTSPSALVNQAATGAFTTQTNFNAWSTGYQGLLTAYPTAPDVSDWQLALDDLALTGQSCDIDGMTSWQCSSQMEDCWNEVDFSLSAQSPDCLPSSYFTNDLYGLTDPADIDPAVG